jgi:hypothetical protein
MDSYVYEPTLPKTELGAAVAQSHDQGMNMFWRCAGCLLLLLMMSACGDSPTAPSINLAGRWQGNFSSDGDEPGTFTLQLTQAGRSVTGPVSLAQNEFTNVPGNWTGTLATGSSTMQFTLTYAFGPQPCQGQFDGTVNVTDRELDGSFSGHNCGRTFNGKLHATKAD